MSRFTEESEKEKEEDFGVKKRRQLPEIADKVWDGVNKQRKGASITWDELFKRMYYYEDWVEHLLELPKRPTLGDRLNAVTVVHYLPMWLESIRKSFVEKCTKDVRDVKEIFDTAKGKPGIVIGAGPSLEKHHHLELLAKSRFYKEKVGPVLTTSHTLVDCLEAGVIPDYMILLDPEPVMMPHIDHDIVDEYAGKITGVFSISIDHEVLRRWKGEKVFFLAAIPEATIPNIQGVISRLFPMLTEMNALANAGTFAWNVAQHLGCNPIILIGMDQAFLADTPVEETPYYKAFQRTYNTREEILDNCYHFHTHSFFKNNSYTDDIYRNFMKNTVAAAKIAKKNGISTINCTGGGFIDDPDIIENRWFEDFLKKWEKR